jgi:hypothetical protein
VVTSKRASRARALRCVIQEETHRKRDIEARTVNDSEMEMKAEEMRQASEAHKEQESEKRDERSRGRPKVEEEMRKAPSQERRDARARASESALSPQRPDSGDGAGGG